MKISYLVTQQEITQGRLHTLSERPFDTVEEAIAFREGKRDGEFVWWGILVDYTK